MLALSATERQNLFICFTVEGVVNLSLTTITLFIILKYSPKNSGSYKWFQTIVLTCGLLSDVSSSILCPMPVQPDFGFYSVSKIRFTPTVEIILFGLYTFAFLCQIASLIVSLLYKSYTLLLGKEKRFLRVYLYPWTIVVCIGLFLFPFYLIAAFLTGLEERTAHIVATTPEYSALIGDKSVIIFPFDIIYVKLFLITTLLYCPYAAVAIFIPFYFSIRHLMKAGENTNKFSEKTINMQKRMVYSLFAQLATPILTIGIPYFSVAVRIVFNITILPEQVTRLVVPLACTHTPINCTIIFAFSASYRKELIRILMCRKEIRRRNTVSVTRFVRTSYS